MTDQYQFYTGEMNRHINGLVRVGRIAEVDHAARRLKVRTSDTLTGWLPWPATVGRNFVRWQPLRVGTQVVIASQVGDLVQAAVVGVLYTQDLPSPSSDPDLDLIQWNDGSHVSYNIGTKEMSIFSAGDLSIKAAGDLWLDAQNIHVFEKE